MARPPLARTVKIWFPQVGICLLLQAGIASGAMLLDRWIAPESPCCDRPLVL